MSARPRYRRPTKTPAYRCICGRTFGSSKWLRDHEAGCLQQRIEADLAKRAANGETAEHLAARP